MTLTRIVFQFWPTTFRFSRRERGSLSALGWIKQRGSRAGSGNLVDPQTMLKESVLCQTQLNSTRQLLKSRRRDTACGPILYPFSSYHLNLQEQQLHFEGWNPTADLAKSPNHRNPDDDRYLILI
ncbi:hypothetical protein FRC03_006306 [Tulasnella sp. 419]|nr:hypothetical protein FRC02_006749 [Tulasnella sp. 418]KAG8939445.1 hypothetical protein FRC03_006306 [Tulasnella sp. 419]